MPQLIDPQRRSAYLDALTNWQIENYIRFAILSSAYRWLRKELDGITLREIRRLMHEFVAAGGEIDEVPERRPEWSNLFEFHYDLRFAIQDIPIYVETRLHYRLPVIRDASWIEVVKIHAP